MCGCLIGCNNDIKGVCVCTCVCVCVRKREREREREDVSESVFVFVSHLASVQQSESKMRLIALEINRTVLISI